MFMYNGTDYTLYIVVVISIIILFFLQYFLLSKSKWKLLKFLPMLYVIFVFIMAFVCYMTPGGGFIDLSKAVAMLIAGYGSICFFAVAFAWIIYKMKNK